MLLKQYSHMENPQAVLLLITSQLFSPIYFMIPFSCLLNTPSTLVSALPVQGTHCGRRYRSFALPCSSLPQGNVKTQGIICPIFSSAEVSLAGLEENKHKHPRPT